MDRRSLRVFTCCLCSAKVAITGGGAQFKCDSCKTAAGISLGRTPQREAHKAVADAIRSGLLKRPAEFACVDCGKPAEHYDHRDYSRPLDVAPVCRVCNYKRGPAVDAINRPAQIHRIQRRRLAAGLDVRSAEAFAPVRLVHGLHPRTRAPGPS